MRFIETLSQEINAPGKKNLPKSEDADAAWFKRVFKVN